MQTTYSPAGYQPDRMNDMAAIPPRSASGPHSRPGSRDRSAYRLFPSSQTIQPPSPRTFQLASLERAGSLRQRRSVSLDESARENGLPRRLLSQRSHASLRRNKTSVPDIKTTMSTVQELPQDSPTFPAKFSYKPRVSDDGGHGRSSSAPEDYIRDTTPERNPDNHYSPGDRSAMSSETNVHGLGLTLQRKQSAKTPTELRDEAQRKQHRNLRLKIEKPLPPRPGSMLHSQASHHHTSASSRSHPPLSFSQSASHGSIRQDSVTQITSFNTPSAPTANDDSYFPLSSDAKVRELMGLPPSPEKPRGRRPEPISTRTHASQSPSLTMSTPCSKFQFNTPPADIPNTTERTDHASKFLPRKPLETRDEAPQKSSSITPVPESSKRISDAPDMSMMPQGLRFATTKRSASASRAPMPPPTLEPRKWVPPPRPATASSTDEQSTQAIATLAELTKQSEALYARHASLRSERQKLSSSIIESLRDNKPGPEYANVLLDQHMSLAAISSSMDICVAKLKSLECRKEEAIATLTQQASSKRPNFKSPKTDSMRSTTSTSSGHSARSSPAMISQPQPSPGAMSDIINMYGPFTNVETAKQTPKTANAIQHPFDHIQNEPARRMNAKGTKAAKILGLVAEVENERPNSQNTNLSANSLRSKPSLTRIDVDVSSKPASPAPDRPLPVPPPTRGRSPAPSSPPSRFLPNAPSRKGTHESVGTITASSRASSPEEREAQTPQEERLDHRLQFSDTKSPTGSVQTVHVYLSEPMMSSTRLSCVGEDDLIDYYRDLQ